MLQSFKASLPANQLASRDMSEGKAQTERIAADDPLAALRGGGGYATILVVLGAAGAVVLSLIASASATPLLISLLATMAMLGVFFLFGIAAGHIRIGERLPEGDLLKAIADAEAGGLMIVPARGGPPLYANRAISALLGRSNTGALGTFEDAFNGIAEAAPALYRLSRAAAAGEAHAEVLARPGPAAAARRCLRISVKPFSSPSTARDPGPLAIWSVEDVTDEREAEARKSAGVEQRLALYDTMPLGLVSVDADGFVTHANRTFADSIGLAPEAIGDRALRLRDLVSNDGAAVLMGVARGGGEPIVIDLDVVREDGRLVPMRLSCRAAESGGGIVIGCFDRQLEAAATADSSGDLRLSRFFQSAPFGVATVAADGTISNANAAFARMILDGTRTAALPALEALTRDCEASTRIAVEQGLDEVLGGRGNVAPIEISVGSGAAEFTRRVYMSPLAGATGASEAAVLYVLDATEQKRLEARFAQSNKMEAVGTLAGGIAHDFNNMLTAIIGYSDFLLLTTKPGDPAHKDLMGIKAAANRAAGLVSKLLAFSRQQTLQNEVIQLGEMVSEISPLLKRSIGVKIELKVQTERDLWTVRTDKTQIDRVIVNLVVNARDAMPDGGTLTIRTRNVTERECQKMDHFGLAVGEYVLVEVEDTGCGMSPETMNKIFEPFFTTKGVGKGTGLGLATVYGIVKQSGGFIFTESEIGKGTKFRVFLPRHAPDPDEEAQIVQRLSRKEVRHAPDLTGSARVLLVEDEDGVRTFAVRALRSRGFEVLEASNGAEALDILAEHKGRLDIVVSDVVMPEMDGPTLLKELRKSHPDLKFVFMSGYPNDAFRAGLDQNESFGFLPKPFSLTELVSKVKDELAD
ncbi:MAG: response regulator [Hyphomicrobiaceae bacterium]|nr:response regulator [Hyphomicrobiaceae bacterium]